MGVPSEVRIKKNCDVLQRSIVISCFSIILKGQANSRYLPIFSTITMIPTTLRYSPYSQSVKGVKVETAVTRPHGNHQDVGSNPADARNEKKGHCADPCTEGAPIVWQGLSGGLEI